MFTFDLSKPLTIITISTRQIFFNTFSANLERLISFIRQEFSLPIAVREDLLKANPLGKILLEMHQSVQASYKQETKTTINFEHFGEIINFASSATNYDCIKETIDALNEIIIKDIKTSEAHLNYCDIDCITAQKILTDLVNTNSDSTPSGVMLWRVCLNIKRDQGHTFVVSNADLINRIRQVSSFQNYEPIDDKSLTTVAIENPWILALFTKKQLLDLFICSSDALIILKKELGLRSAKTSTDEVIELGNSLFSSQTDKSSKGMHFPVLTEKEQLKRALVSFLAGTAIYARKVINDTVSLRQFLTFNGFHREFVPFLEPATIIKLFCELDTHTADKAQELRAEVKNSAVEIQIDAHRIRGCNEFKWLLTRIEEDIKTGTDPKEYFSQNKDTLKIPYLLYELILRGLLQFPLPIVLNVFKAIDPDVILETLQLLDIDDLVHNYIEIGDAKDKYYVDKSNPISFHRLMQLLLSDEFIPLRLSWFNNQNTSALILTYPILLKGLSYTQMQQLMSDHSAIVLSNAEIGIQKVDFNPYVVCPLLLAYLPEQHIKFIKLVNSNPAVRKLYVEKLLPPEVLIHYIKNYTFDVIRVEIPEIMNYVDLDLFTKVDKSILDKPLLMAMLADEKFRMVLKLYPSILNAFAPSILSDYINNTNADDAIFLRQVARQAVLIELILIDFDKLMSHDRLHLFKHIIQNLYGNPETDALIEKIEHELKLERDMLLRNYDQDKDKLLIAKGQKTLEFTERPYKVNLDFPEHDSQAHIDEMLLSKTLMADPIVFLLEEIIKWLPHWACRFVQSPGFYPVLNQYCMQILHTAGDNINRDIDHCSAIFQFASLYIKLEEFENAAILLKDYLMLLGVKLSTHNYHDTAFYLFINCAEHLSKIKPLDTLNYYFFAAALLDAEKIDVARYNEKIFIKDNRYKLAMSLELAKKTMALISKSNLSKDKYLDLVTYLCVLLARGVPLINQHSPEISIEADEHQNVLNALINCVTHRPVLHTDSELLEVFKRINHYLNRNPFVILDKSENVVLEEKQISVERKSKSPQKIAQLSGSSRMKIEKELLELMQNYTLALRKNHYLKRKNKLPKSDAKAKGEPDSAPVFKKPVALPKSGLLKPFLEKLKSAAASPRVSFDGKAKIGDKEEELRLQKEREDVMRRVTMVIADNESSDESSGEENDIPKSSKTSVLDVNKPTEPLKELTVLQDDTNSEQPVVSISADNNPPNFETDSDWQNRMNAEIKKIQPENAISHDAHIQINEAAEKEKAEKEKLDREMAERKAAEKDAEEKRKLQDALEKEQAVLKAAAEAKEKSEIQEAIKKAKEKEDARNKKREEEARKKKEEEDRRMAEKLALQRKIAEDERLRLQIIEDERKEKERIELQKKMEQEAVAKKIAEEKRKKAEEEARLKKEQEDKRRKEEEGKRKKFEEERKLKEQEASEAHKKKLQEFKQKMLNDEREKKLAEEKRMEELERKRKLREERDKELQLAREVKANEMQIAQIAQEEQRLSEEERRLIEEERKLTEELKTMHAAFQSDAAHNSEPQPVKVARKEDPNKELSKAIGKELLNAINDPQDNKAFEVARKRSGSAPVALVNPVNSAGFFAQTTVSQKSAESDGVAMRSRGETQPPVPVTAGSQIVATPTPFTQAAAESKSAPTNPAVVMTKTSSVKDAIAAANKFEAAKNEARAEIAERVERKRSSSQPPAKSAPLVVDDKSIEILKKSTPTLPIDSELPPPRPSLEGVVDEKESARVKRGEIAQQNMMLFAASKAEMEREAENSTTQDEKAIKSGRRRGMSFTSDYEAISFFKTSDKASATENGAATSFTDASRPKLPRSTSMGRITVFHPQPTETRDEPTQTLASASSRPNRFGNPASSIAEKIGVGKLASVPLTQEEKAAIDAQVASSKVAMSNKRKN